MIFFLSFGHILQHCARYKFTYYYYYFCFFTILTGSSLFTCRHCVVSLVSDGMTKLTRYPTLRPSAGQAQQWVSEWVSTILNYEKNKLIGNFIRAGYILHTNLHVCNILMLLNCTLVTSHTANRNLTFSVTRNCWVIIMSGSPTTTSLYTKPKYDMTNQHTRLCQYLHLLCLSVKRYSQLHLGHAMGSAIEDAIVRWLVFYLVFIRNVKIGFSWKLILFA